MGRIIFLLVVFLLAPRLNASDPDVNLIKLPPGFAISVYGTAPNARAMALSKNNVLFTGSMSAGRVYAMVDNDGDKIAEETVTVAEGLEMPVGVAILGDDLYVSAVNRILKFANIEKTFRNKPAYTVVTAAYPSDAWHGWKFIRFGPDGKLYVPVGAPCNVCLNNNEIYSTITRINPDGTGLEIFSRGIRNTVGFDWHPDTKRLWFTENGRDMMGDDTPPDELNFAPLPGMHFGFPYMHGMGNKDPRYWKNYKDGFKLIPPVLELGAHVAALGMRFYTGSMFPEKYRKHIFIAEHGSWNRSKKSGYRLMFVRLVKGAPAVYEVFADGWKQGEHAWGRPVDVENAQDGSIYISDDKAGAVYRIHYKGNY